MLFLVYLTVTYPALALAGNPDNLWQIPAFMGMIVVIGLALYYGAKMVRQGPGRRHRPRLSGAAARVTRVQPA